MRAKSAAPLKRGRPRKVRPQFGDPTAPGMSLRDIGLCLGVQPRELSRWKTMAALPKDQVEAYLSRPGKIPKSHEVELLARRHIGKSCPVVVRSCPHCGLPLRITSE
jgi:hypothetical protein